MEETNKTSGIILLREKIAQVLEQNKGQLRVESRQLQKELEDFVLLHPKLSCRLAALDLGMKEHQYYNIRARVLARKNKAPMAFREIKIAQPVKEEHILLTTKNGVRIETRSMNAVLKILSSLEC